MGLWEISTDDGATFTDFDNLYFFISSWPGSGMVPVKNLSSPLALQPGATYDKTAIMERPFSLVGAFNTDGSATLANFHSRKATLLRALNANAATTINTRPSPIVLKYTGATADKIIYCYYEGGFEDSNNNGFSQDPVTLRFVAFDPFFYATSESNTTLDSSDSATFTIVGAKIDGLWDNLGPPNASGTYVSVRCFAEDDTYIYIGGSFINFDNIAAADYIVRMNKSTQVYSALSALNGIVVDMAVGPDGTLYAVGQFTNAGAVANADYIASWNGTAWSAVGNPNSGGASITEIASVAVAQDGNVYIGGTFTNLAGIANADAVAYWDGSAWNAMGTGTTTGYGADILALRSDEIYYVGNFTGMGGVSNTNQIAMWDGSAWNAIADGDVDTGSALYSITADSGGNLYVGGSSLTQIGGVTVSGVAKYNGTSWDSLGGGTGNSVNAVTIDSNGLLYASGTFTTAGAGIAVWNGSVWTRADITLPGSPTVYRVHFSQDGDLYIGFDTDGTATYAGNATIAYAGTAVAYPHVTINRSGGTAAQVVRLTNITTGAEIYIDYDLLDGETLTIDLRPFSDTPLTATSSFFGLVPGAILGGSNTGNFYLTPGRSGSSNNNVIALYVLGTGSPTITATLYYTVTYLSQD